MPLSVPSLPLEPVCRRLYKQLNYWPRTAEVEGLHFALGYVSVEVDHFIHCLCLFFVVRHGVERDII